MAKNANLHAAKTAKNDEFYTRYDDINAEIKTFEHGYRPHFEGKVVYCNCDDPEWSNFWKFFKTNFVSLKLKKLISTHYDQDGKSSYVQFYDGTATRKCELEGDGDFRSAESIDLIKQSDIIATNPPFSLFREYVAQLMEYEKKFIIIGNNNAITYKEIFPLIKNNQIWLGYGVNKTMTFGVPMSYSYDEKLTLKIKTQETDNPQNKECNYGNVPAISWFTNLDIPKRHYPIELGSTYYGHETRYPKYDNYDAINVNKVSDIPCDYEGVMGVPITFLDKFCPKQFEIVDAREFAYAERQRNKNTYLIKDADSAINGTPCYARIAIRKKVTQ